MMQFLLGERVWVVDLCQYGVIEQRWIRHHWDETQPFDYYYCVKLERWGYANVFQEKLRTCQIMH